MEWGVGIVVVVVVGRGVIQRRCHSPFSLRNFRVNSFVSSWERGDTSAQQKLLPEAQS